MNMVLTQVRYLDNIWKIQVNGSSENREMKFQNTVHVCFHGEGDLPYDLQITDTTAVLRVDREMTGWETIETIRSGTFYLPGVCKITNKQG